MTHHTLLQNIYILLTHVLGLFLLYKLFDSISVQRRLCLLGIISVLPSTLWASPINFTERLMLIETVLSLLCLKNFIKTNSLKSLIGFLFWMNVVIYVKETCFLFYFMFLLCLIFRQIYQNEITLASFLHPIHTIQKSPLAFLMGLSLLIWFVQYSLICFDYGSNPYLIKRQALLAEVFKQYSFEIGLALMSLWVLLSRFRQFNFDVLIFMANFLSFGFILFGLRLISIGYTMGMTYYVYVPIALMTMALGFVRKDIVFALALLGVLVFGSFRNNEIAQIQQGQDNVEMAEFVKSLGKCNIFLEQSTSKTISEELALIRSFNEAFYEQGVRIKLRLNIIRYVLNPNGNLAPTDEIEKGDYILIKKNFEGYAIRDTVMKYPHEKVFENKTHLIYRVTDI